jgi:predicted Zn-ribbon and HTH transcriptional regulator
MKTLSEEFLINTISKFSNILRKDNEQSSRYIDNQVCLRCGGELYKIGDYAKCIDCKSEFNIELKLEIKGPTY